MFLNLQLDISVVRRSKQCMPCCTADAGLLHAIADNVCCVQTSSAVSHSRQCLLRRTADLACCVTRQILSAVWGSSVLCCVARQSSSVLSPSSHCLLCDAADPVCLVAHQTFSAVSRSRHCLLCRAAGPCLQSDAADIVCCATRQEFFALSRQCLPCDRDIVCLGPKRMYI